MVKLSLVLIALLGLFVVSEGSYQLGVGRYDITGPIAEVGMMGYAMGDQTTAGLHFRLRARAFIVSDGKKRVVFVNSDSCMIYPSVKRHVIEKLQAKYGSLYGYENVMLSGTHTHSGPAGYSQYVIFDITSLGFVKKNWQTIIDGIYESIVKAHENLKSGVNIFMNSGDLYDSNINRSPSAYLNNPAEERAKYKNNTDTLMTLLKFEGPNSEHIGMFNWFAVHGTSMNNTNHLVSGDNKGYASMMFEKQINGVANKGSFVGAFVQSNCGDVSPNIKGAFCDNGDPCETAHSTCNGRSQGCHGYGPGENNDNFENVRIIGTKQKDFAWELFNNAKDLLEGEISYVHTFLFMENITVTPEFSGQTSNVKTCPSALGDGFAAGTTDGPGDFNFKQGTNASHPNKFWNFIAGFLSAPSKEQIACQYPKPILFNTAGISFPAPWEPHTLPIQIFRIGQLFILGCPGEFTTMAGRRLRDTVHATLASHGMKNHTVIIAGLTNAYSHYIATPEEFIIQRYESASTLYGPHTLPAYQQEFSKLATALMKGQTPPAGTPPPNLDDKTFSFLTGVVLDEAPIGKKFGTVKKFDSPLTVTKGDQVKVEFWGANPRNDFRTESDGFLAVLKSNATGWEVVYNDGDWETKLYWKREAIAESVITILFDITDDVEPGTYRIEHYGTSKNLLGHLTPYVGTSPTFLVK